MLRQGSATMAAKKTSDLTPCVTPLQITGVELSFSLVQA